MHRDVFLFVDRAFSVGAASTVHHDRQTVVSHRLRPTYARSRCRKSAVRHVHSPGDDVSRVRPCFAIYTTLAFVVKLSENPINSRKWSSSRVEITDSRFHLLYLGGGRRFVRSLRMIIIRWYKLSSISILFISTL